MEVTTATRVVQVDPILPVSALIEEAANTIRADGTVAFPTETVYGLGANALSETAVKKIFAAKGRPSNNPLIVHVADIEAAKSLTADWPVKAQLLAERYWPGPLTLVLPHNHRIAASVSAGGPTVAIRCPKHAVALKLLRLARVPIAAPSANRSGRLSPTLASHVVADLNGRIDFILDAGPTTAGIESTVIDLSVDPPRLLRPGPIPLDELERIVGPIEIPSRVDEQSVLPSPGMMTQHYAPRTPLQLVADRREIDEHTFGAELIGIVSYGSWDDRIWSDSQFVVEMPTDVQGYQESIYRVLHELDAMDLSRLLVELPPRTESWAGVHDRLARASAKEG